MYKGGKWVLTNAYKKTKGAVHYVRSKLHKNDAVEAEEPASFLQLKTKSASDETHPALTVVKGIAKGTYKVAKTGAKYAYKGGKWALVHAYRGAKGAAKYVGSKLNKKASFLDVHDSSLSATAN